jgi:hypothetical protein
MGCSAGYLRIAQSSRHRDWTEAFQTDRSNGSQRPLPLVTERVDGEVSSSVDQADTYLTAPPAARQMVDVPT